MNILVINGSPAGNNSITLQTVHYLERHFPECHFDILHAGAQIRKMEKDFAPCAEALESADLLLFCYPVYTFLVPAQLHRFIELMKEHTPSLQGKYATQLTTSKHFYDTTAHQFIEDNCKDLGLSCIRGLSADMEDLLKEKGRKEALDFFRFVLWNMQPECVSVRTASLSDTLRVAVVTDLSGDTDHHLQHLITQFQSVMPCEVSVTDLAGFPFAGGCLGCFHCASDGTCIYKDGFDDYLREQIQSASAIVYAYRIKDHSMGYRFKLYDDRQFCNGHRTVTMGKPVGYLVCGDLEKEPNLQVLMEARAQVGGNFPAGIVSVPADAQEIHADEIRRLAATLLYALQTDYQPPKNFYGVGGLKIFRDLIYQMQGLMKADHKFYKEHGFYDDFPQKHRLRIAAMYLVGGMMRSKSLSRKIGSKMTEGMLMPYKKVLK